MDVSSWLVSRAPFSGLMKKGVFFDLRFRVMDGWPSGDDNASKAVRVLVSM